MPRVTVAILAYNRPELLGEAIESVLAQTYTDFKLVIYDNCSTKDLKSVVDRYDDPRVVYHRNETNIGMFGNAAQCIDLCDTELLDIFHDDDRMFPWALERLVEAMDKYPDIGIASSGRFHIMGSSDFHKYEHDTSGIHYKKMEFVHAASEGFNVLIFSGIMLRPGVLRQYAFNYALDKGVAEDYWFGLAANLIGIEAFRYDAPIIEYRVHSTSITNTSDYEKWSSSLKRIALWCSEHIDDRNIADGIKNALVPVALHFFKASFFTGCDRDDIVKLLAEMDRIQNEWGSSINDRRDLISTVYLGDTIADVGRATLPISSFFKRYETMRRHGIEMSFVRRIKWFLKYIVWQRWLGRRPK